ncbi:MAG: hypothetical protein ACLPJY_20555, partial [Rhodomicrobium sp.]
MLLSADEEMHATPRCRHRCFVFAELLKKGHLVQVRATHNKYQQIEHLFNQSLNYQSHQVLSDEQKNLLT